MARTIRGTNGSDRFTQNRDTTLDIRTFGGNDVINLNRSDDLGGDNFVDAGNGNDTVVNAFEGGNVILLGRGNDVYVGTGFSSLGGLDGVDGGAGNDQFFLQTLKSAYHGGAGKDLFVSDGWQNNINGGDGIDTISYQLRHQNNVIGNQGVTIDLAAGAAQTGASRFETLTSIENAIGSERGDIIGGTNGNNMLFGIGGDDELYGFGGRDMIVGGQGSDILFGGTEADRFVFQKISDSTFAATDEILDFNRSEGDLIDMSEIDAVNGGRDQAFTFIGTAAFNGTAGQLRFAGGMLTGDTNGDGVADFRIAIDGQTAMQTSDFIL